jgi:hypothetical protein
MIVYAECLKLTMDTGPTPVEICDDGIDNDGDTQVDAADPDCAGPTPLRDSDLLISCNASCKYSFLDCSLGIV